MPFDNEMCVFARLFSARVYRKMSAAPRGNHVIQKQGFDMFAKEDVEGLHAMTRNKLFCVAMSIFGSASA